MRGSKKRGLFFIDFFVCLFTTHAFLLLSGTESMEKRGAVCSQPVVLCMGRADISVFDACLDYSGFSVWAFD